MSILENSMLSTPHKPLPFMCVTCANLGTVYRSRAQMAEYLDIAIMDYDQKGKGLRRTAQVLLEWLESEEHTIDCPDCK